MADPIRLAVTDAKPDSSGTMLVPVPVDGDARFDSWAYSDHDKAVLVSFVVILPARALEQEMERPDGDLRELFGVEVEAHGHSFSTQLVSVFDLGED